MRLNTEQNPQANFSVLPVVRLLINATFVPSVRAGFARLGAALCLVETKGGVMAGNKELLARGFAEAFGLIYKPTYLFIRDEGFYPLELKDDADAIANAKCNKGTRKVIRAIDETVVWEETRTA